MAIRNRPTSSNSPGRFESVRILAGDALGRAKQALVERYRARIAARQAAAPSAPVSDHASAVVTAPDPDQPVSRDPYFLPQPSVVEALADRLLLPEDDGSLLTDLIERAPKLNHTMFFIEYLDRLQRTSVTTIHDLLPGQADTLVTDRVIDPMEGLELLGLATRLLSLSIHDGTDRAGLNRYYVSHGLNPASIPGFAQLIPNNPAQTSDLRPFLEYLFDTYVGGLGERMRRDRFDFIALVETLYERHHGFDKPGNRRGLVGSLNRLVNEFMKLINERPDLRLALRQAANQITDHNKAPGVNPKLYELHKECLLDMLGEKASEVVPILEELFALKQLSGVAAHRLFVDPDKRTAFVSLAPNVQQRATHNPRRALANVRRQFRQAVADGHVARLAANAHVPAGDDELDRYLAQNPEGRFLCEALSIDFSACSNLAQTVANQLITTVFLEVPQINQVNSMDDLMGHLVDLTEEHGDAPLYNQVANTARARFTDFQAHHDGSLNGLRQLFTPSAHQRADKPQLKKTVYKALEADGRYGPVIAQFDKLKGAGRITLKAPGKGSPLMSAYHDKIRARSTLIDTLATAPFLVAYNDCNTFEEVCAAYIDQQVPHTALIDVQRGLILDVLEPLARLMGSDLTDASVYEAGRVRYANQSVFDQAQSIRQALHTLRTETPEKLPEAAAPAPTTGGTVDMSKAQDAAKRLADQLKRRTEEAAAARQAQLDANKK